MGRVLIATLGLFPAVVTETVWALVRRDPPWVPDRIEVVTTGGGLKAANDHLQATTEPPPEGPWDPRPLASLFAGRAPPVALYAPIAGGAAAGPVAAYVVEWPGGDAPRPALDPPPGVAADMATARDVEDMGDLILDRLRAAKARGDEVHLSIAGGRKTMSADALLSLSIAGGPTDTATHILVDPAYENHPQFWHPDQGGGPILAKDDAFAALAAHKGGRDAPAPRGAPLDPAAAAASLRLLARPVPRGEWVGRLAGDERLSTIVRQMEHAAEFVRHPRLDLDPAANAVTVTGVTRVLPPVDFVQLRLLATARAEGWTSLNDPPGGPPPGSVTAARMQHGGTQPGDDFRAYLRLDEWAREATSAARRGADAALADAARRLEAARTAMDRGDMDFQAATKALAESARRRRGDLQGAADAALAGGIEGLEGQFGLWVGSYSKLRDELARAFGAPLVAELLPEAAGERRRKAEATLRLPGGGTRRLELRRSGRATGLGHLRPEQVAIR